MTESSIDCESVRKLTPAAGCGYRPPDRLTLDAFRGLVCLGVVLMHLAYGFGPARVEAVGDGLLAFAFTYLRPGVESFFVIGGYFWAFCTRPPDRSLSVGALLVRRMLRLTVPYWVAVLGAVAVFWALHETFGRPRTPPGFDDVWPVLLFLQNLMGRSGAVMFPLWSMAPLLQFTFGASLMFWAVRRLFLRLRPGSFARATERAMTVLMTAAVVASCAAFCGFPESAWTLPRVLWAFGLGALVEWWGRRVVHSSVVVVAAAGILVAGFAAGAGLWQCKAVVSAGVLAAVGRGARVPDCLPVRGFAYLGHRSYSVYLTHGVAGMGFIYVANRYAVNGSNAAIGFYALGLVAALGFGFWFYRAVERPVRKMTDSITYRR